MKKEVTKEFEQIIKFLQGHLLELEKNNNRIPQDVFDVTKFFLEEDIDIYVSMDILMRKEHFRGCLAMTRALLENAINLQYIYSKDTNDRARNYKLASENNILKRIENSGNLAKSFSHMVAKLKEDLKDFKHEKRISEKAQEIGYLSTYNDAYRRLSEFVHSSYRPERELGDKGITATYLRRIVFRDALLVTLDALKTVCEKYDLDGGVMVIDNYPNANAMVMFSTNPKKWEKTETKGKEE